MPDADLLSTLKDIHLPKPIGWWPLAPGWYVVISLSLLILGLLFYFLYQRQQHAKAKKKALALLKTYYNDYQNTPNATRMSAQINELLKRVALAYYPRQEVASLQNTAWLDFLKQTSKDIDFKPIEHLILHAPYQNHTQYALEPLFKVAKKWIEQRRAPCLN